MHSYVRYSVNNYSALLFSMCAEQIFIQPNVQSSHSPFPSPEPSAMALHLTTISVYALIFASRGFYNKKKYKMQHHFR